MSSAQVRGLVIGMALGIVWMWLGFGAALLVASLGFIGWLVGDVVTSVASGNGRVIDLWNALLERRTES